MTANFHRVFAFTQSIIYRHRLLVISLMLLALIAFGTVGYMLTERWTMRDALFMTVITLSTVGYNEVGTDAPTTSYRVISLVVMVLGVGTTLYTLGILVEVLLEGRLEQIFGRRRMNREIASLSGHIVVCGGGRVGRELVMEIREAGVGLVVVDVEAPELDLPEDVIWLEGDATDDTVLRAAGLERASSLVTALASDADNVYVTLSARSIKPDLFIVARAYAHGADEKLTRAGADRVVNPQFIGGRRMATYALQPNVAEFLDVTMHDGNVEWRLEEVVVHSDSPMAGTPLGELKVRDQVGCLVLALRTEGRFMNNPDPGVVLVPGTVIIAMGTAQELDALRRWATS